MNHNPTEPEKTKVLHIPIPCIGHPDEQEKHLARIATTIPFPTIPARIQFLFGFQNVLGRN